MFTSKKNKFDAAASIQRFLDQKRDLNSRFKHLNSILNSWPPNANLEKCRFFDQYRLEIFHLFYDFVCHIEASLPGTSTSGSSLNHHTSIPISFSRSLIDLEYALAILEQLLIFSADILAKRWQYNAILTAMKKFLHPKNTLGLRRIAIRLFIIWYQIIGDDQECDAIFSSLVPHLPVTVADDDTRISSTEILLQNLCEKIDSYKKTNMAAAKIGESSQSGGTFLFFARKIWPLAPATSQVENGQKSVSIQAYFEKLLESVSVEFSRLESTNPDAKFQRLQFLLDKIFHFYARRFLSTNEIEDLLILAPPPKEDSDEDDPKFLCAQSLTRWLALYAYSHRKINDSLNGTLGLETKSQDLPKLPPNFREMRAILLNERRNLHFLLQIFKFSFQNLPLKYAGTLGRAFKVLKEWLQVECDLPGAFFRDEEAKGRGLEKCLKSTIAVLGAFFFNGKIFEEEDEQRRGQTILICSRILSLYKYLANNAYCELTLETWTFLLQILLKIVENCVPTIQNSKNDDSAASTESVHSRLSPQLFQTLLVTWVLAGLNAKLPDHLWTKLQVVLMDRRRNGHLVNEWGKVMDSLTKALSLQLYGIDLNDLPSERLSEQKRKKLLAQGQFSVQGQNLQIKDQNRQHPLNLTFQFSSPFPQKAEINNTNEKILSSSLVQQQKPTHKLLTRAAASTEENVPNEPPLADIEESRIDPEIPNLDQQPDIDVLSNLDADIHEPNLSLLNDDDQVQPAALLDDDDDSAKIVDDDDQDQDFQLSILKNENQDEQKVENGNMATSENGNSDLIGPNLLAVIWRRILGCLGDMNSLADPDIHHQYTSIVCRLVETLLIIRQNQEIVQSASTCSKTPPLTPPYPIFAPFLLSNFSLAPNFSKSRLLALDTLCKCMSTRSARVQYTDDVIDRFLAALDDLLFKNDKLVDVLLKHPGLVYNFGFLSRDLCGYILRLEHLADESKLLAINILNISLLEDNELIMEKLVQLSKSGNILHTLHALRGLTMYACICKNYSKIVVETLLSNLENDRPRIAIFASQCLNVMLDFEPENQLRCKVVEKYLSIFQKSHSNREDLIRKFLLDFYHWCSKIENLKPIFEVLLNLKIDNSTLQYILRLLTSNFDRFTFFPCQINEFKPENWTILHPRCSKSIFSVKSEKENFKLLTRNETSKNCLQFTTLKNSDCKAQKLAINRWLTRQSKNRTRNDVIESQNLKIEIPTPPQLPTAAENADSASLERLLKFLQYTSPECFEKSAPRVPSEREIKIANELLNWNLKPELKVELNSKSGQVPVRVSNRNCSFGPFFDWGLNLIGQNRGSIDQWDVARLHDPENEQLKRELKHFDQIPPRQTHKMAVIYVPGDRAMDKQSILACSQGSQLFEQFVAQLGWEVNLQDHDYYTGGLNNIQATAPYYCTATDEILFHVSTRSMGDGDWTKKLRHIGNDEIHIVWCENLIDYRRNIIPTEFCDFLIVIYLLNDDFYQNHQFSPIFRVQIDEKSPENDDYASIGPLFDGAVVDWRRLAPLVRATALNASRATKRKKRADDFVGHRFEAYENLTAKIRRDYSSTSRSRNFAETLEQVWRIGN